MRALLDTSVVLGPRFDAGHDEFAISAVTLAELHCGVLVAADDQVRAHRLRRLTRVSRLFDALPVDDAVAEAYGRLAARVRQSGRQPRARALDLLIAATASAHQARLYTRNADDFRGLEDELDVVVPANG